MEQTSNISYIQREMELLKNKYNSEALNVALNIGILTPEKLKNKQSSNFTAVKLKIKGERRLEKGVHYYKIWDLRTKKLLFDMEIEKKTSIRINEFKRGSWENLLEKYAGEVHEKQNEKPSRFKLKSRDRSRKKKD